MLRKSVSAQRESLFISSVNSVFSVAKLKSVSQSGLTVLLSTISLCYTTTKCTVGQLIPEQPMSTQDTALSPAAEADGTPIGTNGKPSNGHAPQSIPPLAFCQPHEIVLSHNSNGNVTDANSKAL